MTHDLTHYTTAEINTDEHMAEMLNQEPIDIQALANIAEHKENLPLSIQVLLPLPFFRAAKALRIKVFAV